MEQAITLSRHCEERSNPYVDFSVVSNSPFFFFKLSNLIVIASESVAISSNTIAFMPWRRYYRVAIAPRNDRFINAPLSLAGRPRFQYSKVKKSTMFCLTVAIILMMSVSAFSQIADTGKVKIPATTENPTHISSDVSFYLDEVLSDSTVLKKFNPNDIEWINVYKAAEELKHDHMYSSRNNGIVQIYTKPYIKKVNQDKLAPFSKRYRTYIYQNPLVTVTYLKNGNRVYGARELYEIQKESIASAKFTLSSTTPILNIITKP